MQVKGIQIVFTNTIRTRAMLPRSVATSITYSNGWCELDNLANISTTEHNLPQLAKLLYLWNRHQSWTSNPCHTREIDR